MSESESSSLQSALSGATPHELLQELLDRLSTLRAGLNTSKGGSHAQLSSDAPADLRVGASSLPFGLSRLAQEQPAAEAADTERFAAIGRRVVLAIGSEGADEDELLRHADAAQVVAYLGVLRSGVDWTTVYLEDQRELQEEWRARGSAGQLYAAELMGLLPPEEPENESKARVGRSDGQSVLLTPETAAMTNRIIKDAEAQGRAMAGVGRTGGEES